MINLDYICWLSLGNIFSWDIFKNRSQLGQSRLVQIRVIFYFFSFFPLIKGFSRRENKKIRRQLRFAGPIPYVCVARAFPVCIMRGRDGSFWRPKDFWKVSSGGIFVKFLKAGHFWKVSGRLASTHIRLPSTRFLANYRAFSLVQVPLTSIIVHFW